MDAVNSKMLKVSNYVYIDTIWGRFDKCRWNHFEGEGTSILFEFSDLSGEHNSNIWVSNG